MDGMNENEKGCAHSMKKETSPIKMVARTIEFLDKKRIELEKEINELSRLGEEELKNTGSLSRLTENEISRRQAPMFRALAKIHKGTYGICERCGQPIDEKRLSLVPYASICCPCIREENEKNKKNKRKH